MSRKAVCRITAAVARSLTRNVIDALFAVGIKDLHVTPAKSSVIQEPAGFLSMFRRNDLREDPADVIQVLVPRTHQAAVQMLIANKAQLHIPGRGSVISEDVELIRGHDMCLENADIQSFKPNTVQLQHELMGICCIVQRGQGDTVARVALDTGVGVPTINYGTGTGVRDKMGLLRITIPAEKEIIHVATSSYDAEVTMEMMIEAGKLDQPGKGFIYTFPLQQGLLNLKVSQGKQRHAASIEQIVAAMDHIKGGTEWRRRSETQASGGQKRSYLSGLYDLTLICDEGKGGDLVRAAMSAGAAGATIYRMKHVSPADSPRSVIAPSREAASMIVSDSQIESINEVLESHGAFGDEAHGVLYSRRAPQAFTYIAK